MSGLQLAGDSSPASTGCSPASGSGGERTGDGGLFKIASGLDRGSTRPSRAQVTSRRHQVLVHAGPAKFKGRETQISQGRDRQTMDFSLSPELFSVTRGDLCLPARIPNASLPQVSSAKPGGKSSSLRLGPP